ncbi:SPT2 chromatin protein domain containing 1 [Ictidomys tridecemlineatus]|uniref:Protein SPT2 homolog n=1 Tax=Ictidomys tridecemlineatus TaxID=43179 RepID=I3MDA1_ICTTR|nr:protein SPT2 homolog [Ictidomys tridecemlineatus]KAG3285626.1 SPT2 chromatin protein domain containing 1 [Ictidomys tridecemlineatus]
MDFREILLIASKGQGVNNVPKRYSLAVGPPKKDPKVKGVQSAAVQAFLRRKEEELRQKALEEKRRKEELVKKRIELKHDKKARAMAKRTKDNFHGYNGIPIEEKSKKRQAVESHTSQAVQQEYEMEEEDEFLEYNQAESEQEYEEEQVPPKVESKPKVPLKSAPPPMNFTDLLRLAEKKQFEPVEIKVVKKSEERPMTAEELREREFLERKHRKKKLETDAKLPPTVSKKAPSQKESVGTKLSKGSGDRRLSSKGMPFPHSEKKSKPSTAHEKHLSVSSSKSMPGERTKAGSGCSSQPSLREGHDRPVFNGAGKPHSSTYSPSVPKTSASGTQKSATEHKAKKFPPFHPSHSKPGPTVTPHNKAKSPGTRQPGSNSNSAPGRPSPGTARSILSSGPVPRRQNGSSSSGPEHSASGTKKLVSDSNPSGPTVTGTNGPGRPATISSGPGRPINVSGSSGRLVGSSGGPGRPTSSPHDLRQPVTSSGPPGRSVSGLGRSISGSVPAGRIISSSGPGRPVSGLGPGRTVSSPGPPLKPKCTVVSETISSKNIISRTSNGQINGMKPALSGYRSAQGPQRLPFPTSYKRQRGYEEEDDDDEYDSEMDDFIEDEGEPQEEISKHIREIFGYDRKKYKDESDYALRYMESSWKEQQKEEAKSLRLGMQEDLEEMRREEEEMKRRKAKKLKRR